MGGYFQLGNYNEDAYENIKLYINKYLTGDIPVYQDTNIPSYFMKCLNLYNASDYLKEIKKQKTF